MKRKDWPLKAWIFTTVEIKLCKLEGGHPKTRSGLFTRDGFRCPRDAIQGRQLTSSTPRFEPFVFWHSRSPRESPIGALAWREAVGPRRDSQCVSIHNKSVSTLFISISLYSSLFISIYLYLFFTSYLSIFIYLYLSLFVSIYLYCVSAKML